MKQNTKRDHYTILDTAYSHELRHVCWLAEVGLDLLKTTGAKSEDISKSSEILERVKNSNCRDIYIV